MVVLLGDLHLSSSKDYFREISENIIDWLIGWEYNSPDNDLVFLGDLVDSAVNGGLVINWLEKMFAGLKFRSIHIVRGNHDYKKVDGLEQLAYEFLKSNTYPTVKIYEELTEVTIDGLKFLMMPHYSKTPDKPSMVQLYSKVYKTHKGPYDVVVGHFSDEKFPFGGDSVPEIDKINSTIICLGHIHTRIDPEMYIGSVYPCKVSETNVNRAAWILDPSGDKTEVPLPKFAEYYHVRYPSDLPETDALVPIYSIYGANEQVALSKYGNIYIRKTISSLEEKKSEALDSEIDIGDLDQKALFREFVKVRATPMDRRVYTKCLSMLPDTN